MDDKITFLINGTIRKAGSLKASLQDYFSEVADLSIMSSTHGGHLKILAKEAVENGGRTVVIAGGDGSINETVNGMIDACRKGSGEGVEAYDWEKVKTLRLGILPAGSGNDLARTLGLKNDLHRLKSGIERDRFKLTDVGHTSAFDEQQQPIERFFMNITDVGMGGATVHHMDKYRMPIIGPDLNYMKAILSAFALYEKAHVRWTSEHDSWEGNIMSLVVANGRYFGSGLGIAPDAEIDDGLFSIVTLGDITVLDYLLNLRKVKASQKLDHPKVSYHQAAKVTIEPLDGKPLPIDMDGDFGGYCPMVLQCIHQALPVIV